MLALATHFQSKANFGKSILKALRVPSSAHIRHSRRVQKLERIIKTTGQQRRAIVKVCLKGHFNESLFFIQREEIKKANSLKGVLMCLNDCLHNHVYLRTPTKPTKMKNNVCTASLWGSIFLRSGLEGASSPLHYPTAEL